MNEEKRLGAGNGELGRGKEPAEEKKTSAASRARNRTVMLTPEMTGQVRALLYQDPEEEGNAPLKRDPLTELLPPMDWSPSDQPAVNDHSELEARMSGEPINKDLSPMSENEGRGERSGTTGKIDPALVHEAVSSHGSENRRQAAPQPAFSVNAGAGRGAPQASAARRPGADRGRAPAAAPTAKIVAFFISFDKNKFGEVIEIRSGRWLVTSRPTDHGEFILIEDETISPLHAIVRATKDGKVQVLDQLSEFGTGVKRQGDAEEQEVSGTMVNVAHGDVLRLGQRHFVVCMIPDVEVNVAED